MMNNTLITPSQVKAAQMVVGTYMRDERRSFEEFLEDEDIDDDFDSMTDEELYNRYSANYAHMWFYLYELSKIQ